MGGAPSVQAPRPPDAGQELGSAISAYTQHAGQLYGEESQYQPMYNQLQQQLMGSNLAFYSQALQNQLPGMQQSLLQAQNQAAQNAAANYQRYAGTMGQQALQNSPALQQLYSFSQGQLNATPDTQLTGLYNQMGQWGGGAAQTMQNLAQQAGQSMQPINQQLQALSGQVGQATTQATGDVRGIAGQLAADPRSALWNATAQNVQQNLGQLDPLTGQLQAKAQSELALGGTLSESQIADAAQQARAAYSARGMLGQSGSIAAEVLGRTAFQQQLLGQREQFASGVSGLVQNQLQQRAANAMGMSQADIAATQANLGAAAGLYGTAGQLANQGYGVQAGLQGQIASNIQNALQQQGAFSQAGLGFQQAGIQGQASLRGSILDQLYRQQSMGAQGLQNVYAAQQAPLAGVLGAQAGGADWLNSIYGNLRQMGTGAPNLFQGSGMLSLVNQNAMAGMNAQAAANQMNAQSRGAASGAMLSAGAGIAGAAITGIAAVF